MVTFPTRSDTDQGTPRTDWRTVSLVLGGLLLVYYLVPVVALLGSQPPAEVVGRMGEGYVVTAATNSLVTAGTSTLLAAVFGLPLAFWLARTEVRGKNLVTAVVVLPLVLPPIVSGMVLLKVFGPAGLAGAAGIRPTGTLLGVVLAQTFVASPFLVITAMAAFESVDRRLEHASRSLGKDRWTTYRRVTLPLAKPGIIAGLTLTFARSMGEFGATVMVAYYPRTVPVQIWASYLSTGLDAALPLAVILLGIAAVSLVILNVVGSVPWKR